MFSGRFRRCGAVVVLAALAFAGCEGKPEGAEAQADAASGKPVQLEWKFRKGDTFRMTMDVNQKIDQTIDGKLQKLVQTVVAVAKLQVIEELPEGKANVRFICERMRMTQSGAATADMDSDRAPGAPGGQPGDAVFRALVGKGFTARMNRSGVFEEVKGCDDMIESMIAASPVAVDPASRQMLRTQFRQQFGDDAMREQFGPLMDIYPEVPVDNGATWKKSAEMTRGFPVRIETTHKLLSHDEKTARVGMTGVLMPTSSNKPMEMGQLSMVFALKGTQKGDLTVDLTSGWPSEMRVYQDFAGEVTASGPGIPGRQTWPITIKSDVKTSYTR